MSLISRKSLISRVRKGKGARTQFVESHLNKGLAYQIRAIRDRLHWSQEKLANEVGMPQNAISRLESPDYGKPTLTTLKRLAAAFDVGLVVRFVPFSELVDWVSGTPRIDVGLSGTSLAAAPFDEEDQGGILDVGPVVQNQAGGYQQMSLSGNNQYTPATTTMGYHITIGTTSGVLIRKPVQSAVFVNQQLTNATGTTLQ
jgi:transcriptional regulator with XRE-family HTH domain